MVVTQQERLEAVYTKLKRIEKELRQTKRILAYYEQQAGSGSTKRPRKRVRVQNVSGAPDGVGDREGLYDGQLNYIPTERPSYIRGEESDNCET